jgi:uncharacterized delta-60 repeat protein
MWKKIGRSRKLSRLGLSTALLAASVSLVGAAPDVPGDLDMSFAGFGAGGKVITSGVGGDASRMALQPDGKFVVVGSTGADLLVMRYLPNGVLDTTFSGDGIATFSSALFEPYAYAVAIQSDGKIVVGVSQGTSPADFMLARLTPAGELDPSFGNGGFVTTDFSGDDDFAAAVLIQPDGKIVAAGGSWIGGAWDFVTARYNTDGSLDTTFAGDGKGSVEFGSNAYALDIALQEDSKLVLVGENDGDFAVARLNKDGTLDNSFDGDGKLTTGFGDYEYAYTVAIQPDGKIVAAGSDGANALIARYHPNGALDDSIDGDGKRSIAGLSGYIFDAAIQPVGKILLLGFHRSSPDSDRKFTFYRLNPDGSMDTTFDGDGNALIDLGGDDIGHALALQPDGRIIASGMSDSNHVLLRLWPDGSFDTGGQQTHGLAFPPGYQPGQRESANGLALQPDGSFLVAGEVYVPDSSFSSAFVTRFNPDGLPDPSFGTNGSIRTGFGLLNNATAVAVQPDGKVVIAGYSIFDTQLTLADFLVARFHPNGAPDTSFGLNGSYLIDFANGADAGTALALAPDGKIVVAGNAWNGARQIWGIARLTDSGLPDTSFDMDGKAYVDFIGANFASAVVVQPDGKIIIGGDYNGDFFLQRLLVTGERDSGFGINGGGYNFTDMGGTDGITALALAPNGWLYAAGYRRIQNNADMALAQYTPEGMLASCADPANCHTWPTGTFFVDVGINDHAYALDLREDNQLVAAGCINRHFAGVQVRTDGDSTTLLFNTDMVGLDCARAVKFSGANKIVMAGTQELDPFSSDMNIALARFETTVNSDALVFRVFLPLVLR